MDKVEKIREEVERLYNQSLADENRQTERGLERAANVSYGKSKACNELISFIDSLQEELYGTKDKCKGCNNVKGCITCVDGSEWAHYEEPVLSNVQRTVKDWKEEPIIEVLDRYLDRVPDEEVLKTKTAINEWFNVYFPKLEPVSEELENELMNYMENSFTSVEKPDEFLTTVMQKDDLLAFARHFTLWQKKQTISKACEWLKNNINCSLWIMDFKKYMED